ncbi:unnamed protein product, partial [Polarella glacialis]
CQLIFHNHAQFPYSAMPYRSHFGSSSFGSSPIAPPFATPFVEPMADARAVAASAAQTYSQGPLKHWMTGPLTAAQLAEVKKEFQELKQKEGMRVPVRSHMDDEEYDWRFGAPPDYDLANLAYLSGKTMQHAEGSLEQVVEDLVKTWEFERSHKLDPAKHKTVDQEKFMVGHDGQKMFNNTEANQVGNYNVLLEGVAPDLWAPGQSWHDTHQHLKDAFSAFPWEILKVFSGPPTVAFSWRHWAHFTGTYKGNKGEGQLVEMFGFATATVSDTLQLQEVNIYYKPEEWLEVMQGKRPSSDMSGAKSLKAGRLADPVDLPITFVYQEGDSYLSASIGCQLIFHNHAQFPYSAMPYRSHFGSSSFGSSPIAPPFATPFVEAMADARAVAASAAQTYSQGPLKHWMTGPLTAAQLAEVKKEFQELKQKEGMRVPVRSHMDDEEYDWRFGAPPDYDLANLAYLSGKTMQHAEGSLEQVVEDLVKTWEFERSHKLDPAKHKTVDQEKFMVGHDGQKMFNNTEANQVGNYNVLLEGVAPDLWAPGQSWHDTHQHLKDAFSAFPWEILKVFSGPPTVAFSWRHWAHFTGTYKGNKGEGQLVEMFGFATATVSDTLQLQEVNIYYKPEEWLEVMQGKRPSSDMSGAKSLVGPCCPVTGLAGDCEESASQDIEWPQIKEDIWEGFT